MHPYIFYLQGEGGDKRGANSNLAIRRASREFFALCSAFRPATSVKFYRVVVMYVV